MGYWIAHIEVHDLDNYAPYKAASTAAVFKWGGRFVVRGGAAEQTEGHARPRHIIIEFPSYAQALAAYHSPEYRAARALRMPYASADFTVVEGFDE